MNVLQRLALTSYEVQYPPDPDIGDDGINDVMGILPMLWQWAKDVLDHALYDLSITLTIIGDDHPRLRRGLRPVAGWLERVTIS